MSIASEITRLQGVKSDILTAIGDKGVTVPAGSALDDCPGLISSIVSKDISKVQLERFDNNTNIKLVGLTLSSTTVDMTRLCWTPTIHFSNATSTIRIHYEYSLDGYSLNNYSVGFGEWYTNNMTIRGIVSVLNSASNLRISFGSLANIDTAVDYDLGTRIIVDIDIGISNETCNVRVKYGNTLVADVNLTFSDVIIADYELSVGGLRFDESGYAINGSLYLESSYIEIDGTLVWGCK